MASKNRNLQEAKSNKKDEFYTQLTDIERELKYYKKHFKGKVVYCNCDDPRVSNFFSLLLLQLLKTRPLKNLSPHAIKTKTWTCLAKVVREVMKKITYSWIITIAINNFAFKVFFVIL